MRALVIEDECELRDQLCSYLKENGFAVDSAKDGEDGLWLSKEYPADIAIIDLGLPGVDGLSIIKQLREHGRDYPVLVLTARNRWQDKVTALELGADDYLTKPFHMEELMARVQALIRRSGGWAQSELQSGPFTLNSSEKTLQRDAHSLKLTSYEFALIEYLIVHAGEVISKRQLSEHLYAEDDDRDSNVIEVFIRRLRKKLDPDADINPIETRRGDGYRWSLPRNPA